MQLHCLGTTGYHPSATRHTACYYLPQWNLVLDAGSGFFRLSKLLLNDPKESLTILLSHVHLDHVVGLTYLLDHMAMTSLRHVQVVGQREKLEAVREHLFHEQLFPVLPECEFVALECPQGSRLFDDFELTWYPQEHPGGSLGFVLQGDRHCLAYLTDTVSRCESIDAERLRDCDLLLHECYFPDNQRALAEKTGHSWLSEVTRIVEKVRPKQTALIHTNPASEMLGQTLELSEYQRDELKMFIPEDEQVIEF